jgi:hypothetical protein
MLPIRFFPTCIVALGLIVCLNQPSQAQLPQARLEWLFPTGLQAGTSAEFKLSGNDLEGTTRLIFSHSGFSAKPAAEGKWTVNAAADLPAGFYELRAVGAWGVTNPLPFFVGIYPEIVEKEPNDQSSQELKPPLSVNGQIQAAADIDQYHFSGRRGQRLVIDLKAESLDSRLDGALRLFGPDGSQVAESQDARGYDANLEMILPADGTYRLQVFDAVYSGSPFHHYRLAIHSGPVADSALPMAAQPGVATPMRLLGRGFQGGTDANFPRLYGQPEESLSRLFQPGPVASSLAFRLNLSNADAPGRFWLAEGSQKTQKLAEPLPIAVASVPVFAEIESNDTPATAQEISLPADFSGIIQKPGDVDYLRISARKGEVWNFETVAERQNSPAQPLVSIQKMADDGKINTLAELNEELNNPLGPSFETATRDRRSRWQAPADGNYLVRIANQMRREGDARHFYRLVIKSPQPDFRLIAMPAGATGPTGTTFIKGSRNIVTVLIDRIDGFDQAVRVTAIDLPAGVKAWPLYLPGGKNSANMVIEVAADANPGEFALKLVGETRWADEKATVDWVSGEKQPEAFASRLESAGASLVQPLAGAANQQRGISRWQQPYLVAIRGTVLPYQLDPGPQRIFVKRGAEADLEVNLSKTNGFDDKVALRLDNLPANMEAVAGEIAKGQAAGKLKLKVGANVPLGRHTIYINGSAPFGFDKNPAAAKKNNITWNIPSRPFTLVVTP